MVARIQSYSRCGESCMGRLRSFLANSSPSQLPTERCPNYCKHSSTSDSVKCRLFEMNQTIGGLRAKQSASARNCMGSGEPTGENWRSRTPASLKTAAVCPSILYPWVYTTSLIPTWAILILQVKHGQVSQYRMAPSRILSRPASSRAFSSACMQRQVARPTPDP